MLRSKATEILPAPLPGEASIIPLARMNRVSAAASESQGTGGATIAYWRFEEMAGDIVIDAGPDGLDGTLGGSPTRVSDIPADPLPVNNSPNGQALYLNWQDPSNGGFFTVPDVDGKLTLGNQNFTIEAWVKLSALSDTSGNDQRQYICQKKSLPSGDEEIDYAFLAQRGNNGIPNPNYGKTSGFSGQELQLVFGTADSQQKTWGFTSHFEINDLNWHHVSVSYDTFNGVVRFGLDDNFESIAFIDNQKVINDGPVRVGSHQNAEGINNQFLRGTIDELRISRGVLPEAHLLNAPFLDCNENQIADYLDIINLTSQDCNENLIPDECDIGGGISEDCQPDGIADDCQLDSSADLLYDNGFAQLAWRADEPFMAWLNRFNVAGGAGTVDAVDVLFGIMPLGTQPSVYVWSDPNGDGNPADAQVLWSGTATVEQTDVITRIEVPEVLVGDNGASFFVGFVMPVTTSDFPASLDIFGEPIPGRSWGVGANSPINPNNLSFGAVEFGTIDDLLFGGNWVIRAHMRGPGNDCNGNVLPDDCDIAAGDSDDADGNGIPDECEDCNGNSVLDGDDITGGTSFDCHADGVPDECQLQSNDCNDDAVPDDCQLGPTDCNDNLIPDTCDIASGYSEDVNGSGVPDECEDCNGNGTVDSFDIADDSSQDCNEDGVPDECQFGNPLATMNYLYDDGTKESNLVFVGATLDLAWMHHHTVQAGGEWISAIEIAWGNTYPGLPAEVVLWRDPDEDGDPTDAQVIRTVDIVVKNVNTVIPILDTVSIPPTYVGPAGTSFFVGVHFDDIYSSAPIALDVDEPDQEAWIAFNLSGLLDLNNLDEAFLPMQWTASDFFVRAKGFDGLLEFDCNENAALDECDISQNTSADCQQNANPDECDISEGTSTDDDDNGIPDECEGLAPGRPRPHDELASGDCLDDNQCPNQAVCVPDDFGSFPGTCYVPKNRYLTISPNPDNSVPTARRISLDDGSPDGFVLGWAGEPDGNHVCRIVELPHYMIWPDSVSIGDCTIAPGNGISPPIYRVDAIAEGADVGAEGNYSITLTLPTSKLWGDVTDGSGGVPDGVANFGDIFDVVRGFQNLPDAAPVPWLDLDAETPNGLINFADILLGVQAFQAQQYPFPSPGECD
ncbi:MAG: LamG-like jellyroll fold domain-containing protein [Planctomycetota bacterium]